MQNRPAIDGPDLTVAEKPTQRNVPKGVQHRLGIVTIHPEQASAAAAGAANKRTRYLLAGEVVVSGGQSSTQILGRGISIMNLKLHDLTHPSGRVQGHCASTAVGASQ